jgi:serine protease Do/serine protease DegQ
MPFEPKENYIMNRVLGVATLGLAVAVAGPIPASNAGVSPVIGAQTSTPSLAPILTRITPAVVTVVAKSDANQETNSLSNKRRDTQRDLDVAGHPAKRQTYSIGSGVVYDASRGLIITNNHVIDHAGEITVTLADGRDLRATRVGGDPDTDLAVVKVHPDNLTAIGLGDSDRLEVGDFVLAVGDPFQIGQTVTSGIVSGLHRSKIGIERYEDFIQTDAAIYPGNSGGALVDLLGDLIGINTAFIGTNRSTPVIGLAIPINMARGVADQIVEYGEVRRGNIGLRFDDPTPGLIGELKRSTPQPRAVITRVDPESPAARAGLKPGDLVTELGGAPMRDASDLHNRLGLLRVGEVAAITVVRDGETITLRAVAVRQRGAASK